jgi:hypothetical protein
MVSKCVDYEDDHKKIIFEIKTDYFLLISRKCVSDYTNDWLQFFVQLPISNTTYNPKEIVEEMKPWNPLSKSQLKT